MKKIHESQDLDDDVAEYILGGIDERANSKTNFFQLDFNKNSANYSKSLSHFELKYLKKVQSQCSKRGTLTATNLGSKEGIFSAKAIYF